MMPFRRTDGVLRFRLCVGVVFLCFFAFGCSPVGRHRMLTFFFDGVPPLEEPGGDFDGSLVGKTDVGQAGLAAQELAVVPRKVQHGPYAAQVCDGCHNKSSGAVNRLATFTLKREKRELCIFCHEDKRPEVLMKNFKWVHGPVQYGECLICHNPHESANEYMLRLWPVKKQCYFCHDEGRIVQTEIHLALGESDCIPCHNAHAK